MVVCDLHGLFLHSGHLSVSNGEAFQVWVKKSPFHTFSERDFSALKLLKH